MAGGMSKRGGWGPMSERIHAARAQATSAGAGYGPGPEAADSSQGPVPPVPPKTVKHCWVREAEMRLPGLLLEWRRDGDGGWDGRVVRPVRGASCWLVLEDWVPADRLEPV